MNYMYRKIVFEIILYTSQYISQEVLQTIITILFLGLVFFILTYPPPPPSGSFPHKYGKLRTLTDKMTGDGGEGGGDGNPDMQSTVQHFENKKTCPDPYVRLNELYSTCTYCKEKVLL